MFRDAYQRAKVGQMLCAAVNPYVHPSLYFVTAGPEPGPTILLRTTLRKRAAPAQVLIVFTLALVLWERAEGTSFDLADLLDLPAPHLAMVGRLLVAIAKGPDAIDEWIAGVL